MFSTVSKWFITGIDVTITWVESAQKTLKLSFVEAYACHVYLRKARLLFKKFKKQILSLKF